LGAAEPHFAFLRIVSVSTIKAQECWHFPYKVHTLAVPIGAAEPHSAFAHIVSASAIIAQEY